MLTIWGARQHFCDLLTRRSFLTIGAFGAGLSLANLLRARAHEANAARGGSRSALMIYLPGGPSHLDTYDLKPSAPAEFRGEFRPIRTNVPGVDICEFFSRQAQIWDKLAVVRSIVASDEHSDSETMTGYSEATNRQVHHPSLGAVVSKLCGPAREGVPPFVSLRGLTIGLEPGYLGISHRAFAPSGPGYRNLQLAPEVTASRLEERNDLLTRFDSLRRDLDASGTMEGLDRFQAKALAMIASGAVRQALDLSQEGLRSRERYEGFEQFLTARRLLEAGVRCVTVSIGGWDTHSSNFKALKGQLPKVDRAVATLIGDLHERGLGQDVVTVMWGEFGRTPRINANGGRDHWSPVMSALLAGGGLRMGQTVGSSTARGEYPKERPYRVAQVLATVYQTLGIDPAWTFPNEQGRPMYVLDDREPVRELLA
jgi:uncharacterized protein (DUF1501 family)